MSSNSRALHFVLKVASLKKNIEFFRDKLSMKVLRHEVFDEGCEAACNGPYSNKWSKTMIGYGPEDNHFVLELTYNYSVGNYDLGNDLQHIQVSLVKSIFDKVRSHKEFDEHMKDGCLSLKSPDGYKFLITRDESDSKSDITEVCLACNNLERSIEYWNKFLQMVKLSEPMDKEIKMRFRPDQAVLKLRQISESVNHKTAFGRIAFSCPSTDLKPIQALMEANEQKVLTPYLSLDTPGKATVQVVILADPDGHEICFVGDEGFRELSRVDPEANDLIENSMSEDKSDEWFEKKGMTKSQAS